MFSETLKTVLANLHGLLAYYSLFASFPVVVAALITAVLWGEIFTRICLPQYQGLKFQNAAAYARCGFYRALLLFALASPMFLLELFVYQAWAAVSLAAPASRVAFGH